MSEKEVLFKLKNRSAGVVCYTVPDLGITRTFEAGEIKKVSKEEIERLSYEAGGDVLLRDYLQIISEEIREDLGIETEPEYDLTEAEIVDLIKTGDMDHWEDALNFAPAGVIDLIKTLSTTLPITDMNKAQMLKDKTGFDVMKAIALNEEVKRDLDAPEVSTAKPVRKTPGKAAKLTVNDGDSSKAVRKATKVVK